LKRKEKVREYMYGEMEISMKVNGLMVKDMVMVFLK
jgi:hypothetical protein